MLNNIVDNKWQCAQHNNVHSTTLLQVIIFHHALIGQYEHMFLSFSSEKVLNLILLNQSKSRVKALAEMAISGNLDSRALWFCHNCFCHSVLLLLQYWKVSVSSFTTMKYKQCECGQENIAHSCFTYSRLIILAGIFNLENSRMHQPEWKIFTLKGSISLQDWKQSLHFLGKRFF